jgi:hypothetical protein
MSLIRWLAAPALALGIAACAPAYKVEVDEPGFNGLVTTRMRGNVLTRGSLLSGGAVELDLERVDQPDSIPRFAVVVQVQGEAAAIAAREPLLILADGDTLRLPADTITPPRVVYQGVRIERARYPAAPAQLRRLAAARAARLSLSIGAGRDERPLYPRNLENVRRFVTALVPADSALKPLAHPGPPRVPPTKP